MSGVELVKAIRERRSALPVILVTELLTPMASGGLAHYWRNNDDPFVPWFGPIRFGQEAGRFEAVGMIHPARGLRVHRAREGGDVAGVRQTVKDYLSTFPAAQTRRPVQNPYGSPFKRASL